MIDLRSYVVNGIVLLLGIHILYQIYMFDLIDYSLMYFFFAISGIQNYNLLAIENKDHIIHYEYVKDIHHFFYIGLLLSGLFLGLIFFFKYEFMKSTYSMLIYMFIGSKFIVFERIKNKFLL